MLKLFGYCGHAEILEKMFEKGGVGKFLTLPGFSFPLTFFFLSFSLLLFSFFLFLSYFSLLLFPAFDTRDSLYMFMLFMFVIMPVSGFMYVHSPFLKGFVYRTVHSIFQGFLLNI